MVRGLGSGKTPERVVELLRTAVKESSQSAVARFTGIPLSKINRYIKGVGEPQTETLQKLADFFKVTVSYLRGESSIIKIREITDNFDIPGRIEEVEKWIEEDEERRNWTEEQKADLICGFSLVEKVLKDKDIERHALGYMKLFMQSKRVTNVKIPDSDIHWRKDE